MAAPQHPLTDPAVANGRPGRPLLADAPALDSPETSIALGPERDRRRFSVYEPLAAFKLVEELDFLTRRAIEPIPFYAPQFLVPAMPRLDDRHLKLMVARDEGEGRSRLRLLMPFSVEATGLFGGPPCVRAWTHPFGPRGTLLLDHDDPTGTVASLFDAVRDKVLGLPPLLVVPDLRLDGPVAAALMAEAARRGLPAQVIEARKRACLDAVGDPSAFLGSALSARRRRELARVRRRLDQSGSVTFETARRQGDVREALEDFLVLEASGWKGRARSALLTDRYRSAFAREAVDGLAARDRVRIYTLKLDGHAVASVVVLVAEGQAVLWKMAYDEEHASASPGFQLMAATSQALIADPTVRFVDSCAVPDHMMINRIWRSRVEVATLVLGLKEDGGRSVQRAANGLKRVRRIRQAAWRLRTGLRRMPWVG